MEVALLSEPKVEQPPRRRAPSPRFSGRDSSGAGRGRVGGAVDRGDGEGAFLPNKDGLFGIISL